MIRRSAVFKKAYAIAVLTLLSTTTAVIPVIAETAPGGSVNWNSNTNNQEIQAPDGIKGDSGKWDSSTYIASDEQTTNGESGTSTETQSASTNAEYGAIAAALLGVLAVGGVVKNSSASSGSSTSEPSGNGIWVPEADRDAVIKMINDAASKQYYIDTDGFVKEVAGAAEDPSKSSTYSSVIDRLINGDNKVVVGVDNGWMSYGEDGLQENTFLGNNSGITVGDNETPQVVIVSGEGAGDSPADITLAHELIHALRGELGIKSIDSTGEINKDEEASTVELENKIREELGYNVRTDGDSSDGGDGSYGKYSDASEEKDWYTNIDSIQKSAIFSGNVYSYDNGGDGSCITDGYCSGDGDCNYDGSCSIDGRCYFDGSCSNDADCNYDGSCSIDGFCAHDGSCSNEAWCYYDGNCSNDGHCSIDGSCSTDGICNTDGYCVGDGSCSKDGSISTDGYCVEDGSCSKDGSCSTDGYCWTDGSCIKDGYCCTDGSCSNDGSCDTDGNCTSDGLCNTDGSCSNDGSCSKDGSCITDGYCVGDGSCSNDGSCDTDGNCTSDGLCNTDGSCSNDGSCSKDGSCITDGYCVGDGSCSKDGSCDTDGSCYSDGSCSSDGSCGSDTNCSGDGSCSKDGSCSTDGYCVGDGSCSNDGSCDTDGNCTSDGLCNTDGNCSIDGYCYGDGGCSIDGYCYGDGGCSNDGSCTGDGSCISDGSCSYDGSCSNNISAYNDGSCSNDGYCYGDGSCGSDTNCGGDTSCISDGDCHGDGSCYIDTSCGGDGSCNSDGSCANDGCCQGDGVCINDTYCIGDGNCKDYVDDGTCYNDGDCRGDGICYNDGVCRGDGVCHGDGTCKMWNSLGDGDGVCIEDAHCEIDGHCEYNTIEAMADTECIHDGNCYNDGSCYGDGYCADDVDQIEAARRKAQQNDKSSSGANDNGLAAYMAIKNAPYIQEYIHTHSNSSGGASSGANDNGLAAYMAIKNEKWIQEFIHTNSDSSGGASSGADDNGLAAYMAIKNEKWIQEFIHTNTTNTKQIGWVTINGSWYCFDSDGTMVMNKWEQYTDGSWYYLGSDGRMVTNKWEKYSDGKWYYLGSDGKMQTGWQYINSEWYYFNPDGSLNTGVLIEDGGKCYYYDKDTGDSKLGWVNDHGKEYYLFADRTKATGLKYIDKDHYYFDAHGVMQTGWIESNFFDANGAMVTNDWRKRDGKWYYLDAQGAKQIKTGLQTIHGKQYYLNEKGEMVTDEWVQDNGKWYYVDSSGVVNTKAVPSTATTIAIDNFIDQNGNNDNETNVVMLINMPTMDGPRYSESGWRKINGSWYYYNSHGDLVTGWNYLEYNGEYSWYYFYDDGSMAWGRTIRENSDSDLYYVDDHGMRITSEDWYHEDDKYGDRWYYVGGDGTAVTGWKCLEYEGENSWYYFDDDGIMAHDTTIGGLYLDSSGKMVSGTGWINATGAKYYYSDGEKTTGWKDIDGDRYYFNCPGGSMGWSKAVEGNYLGYDGKMVTSEGWEEDNEGNWYYVGSDKKVVTGWKYLEYKGEYSWYYFHPEGSMGWSKVVEGCYLGHDGRWVTSEGWQEDNKGNWYYVGSHEKVVKGWQYLEYEGEYSWYYFDDDGKMAHDTRIDGYYLNGNGKWIPDENAEISNPPGTGNAVDDDEECERLKEKGRNGEYWREYYNMVSQPFGSGYFYGADVNFEYEHYVMVINSEGRTPIEFSDYVNIMGPVWEYKFEHTSTSEKLSELATCVFVMLSLVEPIAILGDSMIISSEGAIIKEVSNADKLKLSSWKYAPDEELYLKYKKVFDNPKYFDQATGEKRWPGQYGDPNIDGFLNGLYEDVMLKPGSKIDRYGGNNGTFFAEEGITIPQRAMAPDSDFSTYNAYEIKREIPVRQGEIAPWFDEVGGGIQYQIDPEFVKIIRAKLMPGESFIDGLIRLGYLKRL